MPFGADERAAELASLAAALRSSYVHLETKRQQWAVDLDALVAAYEPLIRRADTWTRYAGVMASFLAEFHDAHLAWRRPRGPSERRRRIVRLGLGTRFVGEVLVVTEVWPGSAVKRAGIRRGDRIVAIDGDLVEARLGRLASVRSWSRPEAARHDFAAEWPASRVYLDQPLPRRRLTRERDDGSYETLAVAPETAPRPGGRPPVASLAFHGRGAVLRLRSFRGPHRAFERQASALAAQIFARPRGLVIDLRDNAGGFEDNAHLIASLLTVRPLRAGFARVRLSAHARAARRQWRELAEDPARPGWSTPQPLRAAPRAPRAYPGRIAVLVDAGCRSSCESLAMLLGALGARSFGERTGGSSGAPIQVPLTRSASRVTIPARALFDAAGTPIEGLGLQPDERVAPTRAAIAAGRDPVLKRALDHVSAGAGR